MLIKSQTKNKRIIFDGNSLTNQGANGLVGDQRYGISCYTSILALNKNIAYFNYGIGSRRTQVLTDEFATKIGPMIRTNDILVFWEITNEAHDFTGDTTGSLLYSHVVAYCQQAKTYGVKVVCLTGIARDMTGFDDANITNRIIACNNLMRADSSFCDILVDVGALAQFDQKADTTNTTYYNVDRTHLTNVGYDLIASTVFTAIQGIL